MIIIAAGGTGGHVFSAVCVARELQKRGEDVVFSTDTRGQVFLDEDLKQNAIVSNIPTASRSKLYFSLLLNTGKAIFDILRMKPKCVIGFGGYPSVPYVLAAQILRIPTVIHEQNAVMGKANKLLSKMAKLVLASFDLKNNRFKIVGNPSRFESEYDFPKKKSELFTILIFGGSQGAKIFSEKVLQAIKLFATSGFKFKVFHQGRPDDIEKIKLVYESLSIDYVVSEFFDDMNIKYLNSNLIISRAGASTVFEIIGFKVPAILIPYKKSINGDQQKNAEYLFKNNGAIILDEDEITALELYSQLKSLFSNRENLDTITNNLEKIYIAGATSKFADEVLKIFS